MREVKTLKPRAGRNKEISVMAYGIITEDLYKGIERQATLAKLKKLGYSDGGSQVMYLKGQDKYLANQALLASERALARDEARGNRKITTYKGRPRESFKFIDTTIGVKPFAGRAMERAKMIYEYNRIKEKRINE